MQSQFIVSQAIIPKIASGLRHLININDNNIHRILIENTPLTSSISGSASFLLINFSHNYFMTKKPYKFILFFSLI